jgi:hypothetical protein
MGQPTNNSKNLKRTCPTPPIIDFRFERLRQRMSSSQIITIDPGEDGRVRLRSIEFSDIYLPKPAPIDQALFVRTLAILLVKYVTD